MKVLNMSVNGWKSIGNEISFDFNSDIKNTKNREKIYSNNVIEEKYVKIYNKIGVTGSNAFGKTSSIEWFDKLFHILRNISDYDYSKSLLPLKEYVNSKTNKISSSIHFLSDDEEYLYKIEIDFNKEIYCDEITRYKYNKNKEKEIIYTISSCDVQNMNDRMLIHFPKSLNSKNLISLQVDSIKSIFPSINKLKNILSPFNEYEKIFSLISKMGGLYLDFYNSNYEKKTDSPIGLNRLEYLIEKNKFDMHELCLNNTYEWREISRLLNSIDNNLIDIEIEMNDNNTLFIYYIDFNGKKHDFRSYASTGTIQAFALILWMYFYKDNILLIDEIDTSLNIRIIKRIFELSFIHDSQIIFTFHNIGLMIDVLEMISTNQILLIDRLNSGKKILKKWSKLINSSESKMIDIKRYISNFYGGMPID